MMSLLWGRALLSLTLACLLAEAPAFTGPNPAFPGLARPALGRAQNTVPHEGRAAAGVGCGRRGLRAPVMMAPFLEGEGGQAGDPKRSKGARAMDGQAPAGGAAPPPSTRTIKMGDLAGGSKLFDPNSLEGDITPQMESLAGGNAVPEQKVKVFGAYLDHTVAGRDELLKLDEEKIEKELFSKYLDETGNDLDKARELVEEHKTRLIEADRFFRGGVQAMKSGNYKDAIERFKNAVTTTPQGARSRDGGQYTIWLAQALDANGDKGVALRTLKAAMGHADRDVRKVAQGLEFIMLAPKLDLDENAFTWIELEKLDQIKAGRNGQMYAHMEKPPEKYSLEWYMLQKPHKPAETSSEKELTLALAYTALVVGGMAVYGTFFH